MTFPLGKSIGLGVLLVVLPVASPLIVDWCRIHALPPGYGAAGDRRYTRHMPAAVRATVDEQSAGFDAHWVKECVENGAWVYELHVLKDGRWSVVRITPNGNVIRSAAREPESGDVAEPGDRSCLRTPPTGG